MSSVDIAVEGELDVEILKKIFASLNVEVANCYGKRGKNYLRDNVLRYNQAAANLHRGWVVLVDLNQEAPCPPPLVEDWLSHQSRYFQLRVAVRAVESWLLADREEIAHFLRISRARIPMNPEEQQDPKQTLINIARYSKNRDIREDVVPRVGSTARQGPAYTSRLIEFVTQYWDPERAANRAPSLSRSLRVLGDWISEIDL
jgi:hypothetical protein